VALLEPETQELVLAVDAFIRSIGVNRGTPHAVFLGAGASITSGVPSAENCIWEWKRDIFLTNNPGLEEQFSELSLPSVRQRIQQWLNAKGGYPPEGSDEEYGFYVEKCYPIAENRKAFFQVKVRQAKPHIGYQLLALLSEADIVRSAWTTNFDGLVARAAANFQITPIEVGIDCQGRLERPANKGELLCVSLHGDYRYDSLKNTANDLQQQEARLREGLIETVRAIPLIVIGYSGRDHSIMEALKTACGKGGRGTLYWCGFGHEISPTVQDLLNLARQNGRSAFYVPTDGFDDLMSRLARRCLDPDRRQRAVDLFTQASQPDRLNRKPFTIEDGPTTAIIKSNAFEIECPSEVLAFDLKKWPEEKVWKWLEELTEGHDVLAVPFRKVLAFGTIDDVKETFGDNIEGTIERTPIVDEDTRYEDGAVLSLMTRALVTAMAEKAGLESDRKRTLWETERFETRQVGSIRVNIHRMVSVHLRKIKEQMYLVLKPSLHLEDSEGVELPVELANPIKLEILSNQYNKRFNQEMNRWRQHLFPENQQTTFEYPPNSGSTFRFTVRRSPVFAAIRDRSKGKGIQLPNSIRPHLRQTGLSLPEPDLTFRSADGTRYVSDKHPLRGLLSNRPFDFALTQNGLSSQITLGVICPKAESKILQDYLHRSGVSQDPAKTESDYLLSYPGFSQAFRLPLEIPQVGATGWEICPELEGGLNEQEGTLRFAKHITNSIDRLESTYKPNVVLVFVPDRWKQFRQFETDNEAFDLHNYVKAFSVQKGIPTQFLEQETLSSYQQCRVWWWLSVALYVKTMRTPWVLSSLPSDTAFVGLGFSINPKAAKREHIVLGCSHVYNSQGQGLQYRLSRIENAKIINDNPFMSREDASRVGETIRQLFYEAQGKLPRRIVIHKLTPFRKDEREGLSEGLSGVDQIDMLEINRDNLLRYVSSVPTKNGGFDDDNFPVRRGTLVKLEDFTALLWVHGTTESVKQGWRYFQGKRRIPTPVVLRRHAGESDLADLANEILGLSKMDWNSGDLYSKLPATVFSSKEIARLGLLLERFGPMSYDYRLFI